MQERAVVIITGQPGILSGGYDLKVMTSGPKEAVGLVTLGSTLSRRLLSHPFPVVVACPGNGINANLVDKARKLGISIWAIE